MNRFFALLNADAKVGSGFVKTKGEIAAIDYVLSTTGARYGSKIDSTTDTNTPYRWNLGDGSTIAELEQAILGDETMPPMLPGGIRRKLLCPPTWPLAISRAIVRLAKE